mmetsp:Transcript_29200/g.28264  ORF Transcript_29200/g.28264 Transcript_29200/m.28264 type:complete len:127 (-) Transcript_29200:70-450(-)
MHLVQLFIKYDVEKFAKFLEKRSKQPQFLRNVTEGKINSNQQVQIFESDNLWIVDDNELRTKVRVDNPDEKKGPIKLKVLDIPHMQSKVKQNNLLLDNMDFLYQKLQDTDSISIFDNGTIKALIEV